MAQQSDSRSSDPDPQTSADAMTNSSGAVADKDAGLDGATPYGTRSRNRGGNARPNYAEDKDIEMDNYDYYDKNQGDAPKKSSRLAIAGTTSSSTTSSANGGETSGRAAASGRKPLTGSAPGSDDARSTASQANAATGVNGHASGGASASSGTLSRKRKAANGPAQGTAASVAAASAAAGAATTGTQVTRRTASSGAAQNSSSAVWPDTNMLSFANCKARPHKGRMVADDGTVLEANDHVYLVCEPPGEPYYLGRIMEFLHSQNDPSRPVDAVRINWFYRPKDIGRKVTDTRLVIATMHSDISPLAALRGKCQIRHRAEIDHFDDYRKSPDCFWFEKLYDRYIQKHYDLIPTKLIVNVPDKVKKVLDERWKFVLVEQGRGKELTSAVKSCKRCSGYCASNDSVDCAVCRFTYHMNCVRPPLLKKPSRGFAWSCAACSRAQERKLENRHAANQLDGDDDEDLLDEDEEDAKDPNTNRTTPDDDDDKAHHQGTAEQIYHASLWPYRYLGLHCKPEDALDYDDRIYPRASTRIGPRNQATVHAWPGRPVEYVKPIETKRGKGQAKLKDIQEEKAQKGKRPKWVQDQPPGYTARGEDHDANDPNCTATPLWIPPAESDKTSTEDVIAYMDKARETAKNHGLPKQCTNLQDVAINDLYRQNYNGDKALTMLAKTPMPDFKEPRLTAAEERRWEEAISKYGSELFLVKKHVKTMTPGQVVRYYYTWKISERGKQIWGSFTGRKGKKQAKKAEAAASKMADDVADNDDDSAFDVIKAAEKKRSFFCLFCETTTSRQWRRAPNSMQGLLDENGIAKPPPKDKNGQAVVALCRRCAELWRRYGIRWEDIDEVTKKVTGNNKAWRRKQDEELLKELQAAQEHGLMTPDRDSTPLSGTASANGVEPPRKRLKVPIDRDFDPANSDGGSVSGTTTIIKRKDKDRTNEATPVPELPQARTLPCAVCSEMEPLGDQHVSCRECRLTVHRNCYGVIDNRATGKWLCDMCTNDKNPQVSIHYKCVLCPVELTEQEFVEQPKLTHHKKKMSDKDRERERLEVQQARKAAEHYRKRQEELNRPVNPREPLKRTADNNWVHVTCAVWTPEIKFGNSKALEPSEGIPSIPKLRYDEICHACNQGGNGACIPCHQCRTTFHVECARQAGHLLAFDITPVKSSRRDQFSIVTVNGESGTMSAMLWCKDHIPIKTNTHKMHDLAGDGGLNALQLYVQNFKQADLTLTGTVRKANLLTMAAKAGGAAFPPARRVSSTATNGAPVVGVAPIVNGDNLNPATNAAEPGEKVCISCGVDVTPRWWPIDTNQERQLTNGHYGTIGSEAQKFVEQRRFQCHKCKKLAKTPKPHHTPAPLSTPDSRPSYPTPAPITSMPSLRSPPPPPPMVPEYRDPRSVSTWPRPPSSHHHSHHGPPPPPPHPVHAPTLSQSHVTGSRPSHPHAFSAPSPSSRTSHYDWHHGSPPSHHSPPARHLNGGPPQMHGAPPPPPPISSLRPPPMSGPPPPVGLGHRHSPSPMYASSLPPSPRSLRGPPPPPPPSYSPYHGHGGHPHSSPHTITGPPPPPRDAFAHGLHPQRSQYHSSVHVSPSGPPTGPPNGMPPHHPRDPMPPRPDGRPSGASASPSLRNLLS